MPRRLETITGSGISVDELNAKINALKTDLESAHGADRKVLEDRIQLLEDHIQAEKKAKEDKEKAEGTGGTLVLPPDQAPQGQVHDNQGANDPSAGQVRDDSGKPKQGRWKKAW